MPQESPKEQNGRKYRSKKQRPCDLCRSRKTHCKIQENEAACELCKKLNRRCTFVVEPSRRTYNPRARNRRESSLPGETQNESTMSHLLPQDNGDVSRVGMAEADFWLPRDDHDESFNLSASMQLMPMDWSSADFSSLEMMGTRSSPGQGRETFADVVPRRENMSRPASVQSPIVITPRGLSNSVLDSESPTSNRAVDLAQEINSNESLQELFDSAGIGDSTLHVPHNVPDWPIEYSLDSRKGYSNQLIGLSCESDPYLLRHYYYNANDTYPMFRLDFRKVKDEAKVQPIFQNPPDRLSHIPTGYLPIQFVMTHEDIWKDSLKTAEGILSGSTEKSDLELLRKLVPPDLGSQLLKLYIKFVHPRFPVLALSDLKRMPYSDYGWLNPVGIESAVYALSAPFTFLDDELSVLRGYVQVNTEELWAIANRSYQRATCLSHLSSLQLCLLLLQMPPPNFAVADPLSFWSLSCSALALAENLGLNLDPSDWRLPRKEIMLRRRLWWLTYTQHVWQALVIARPSHINDGNWDVANLTVDDFEGEEIQDPDVRVSVLRHIPLCLAECELSVIASDTLKEFYTLKAVRESASLSALLNRAQPLRMRIESWRQSLPLLSKLVSDLNESEFEDGAALRLSHLTLETLIFRALLRPLSYQAIMAGETTGEPITTIFENCYTCTKVGSDIVAALRAKHFSSFWHPYVRFQLCYFSSFILLNLAQSPTRENAIRNKALLGKWRDTLRTQSRVWPLARLATIRLDAVFWKGLSLAVHGAGPDSPAMILIKEQEANIGETRAQEPFQVGL